MSRICGIVRVGGAPVGPGEVPAMLDALDHWGADARGAWREGGAGLGHLMLHNTPESLRETLPFHDARSGLAVTADARIDNREELGRLFGIPPAELARWPDSRLVLEAYRRLGDACVHRLLGDFAFAVWDGPRRRLFCARDPLGIKPFYYHDGRAGFAFASEMKGLLALGWVDRGVDEGWIADFLCRLMVERDYTMYRAIRTLEPAHTLSLDTRGRTLSRYWELRPAEGMRLGSDGDYVEAYREHFRRAVQRRLRSVHPVGAELSGGLDSSGICAMAQRLLRREGQDLLTYSHVRPEGPHDIEVPPDERPSAEAVVAHAGIPHATFLTGERLGVEEALAWALRHFDEPPRLTIGVFKDEMLAAAGEAGVRVLLSGFGGNQGVTDECAALSVELLRAGRWRELWGELSPAGTGAALRALRNLALTELMPGSADIVRRWRGRDSLFWQKLPLRPLRHDLFRRLDVPGRAALHGALHPWSGTPVERMAQRLAWPSVAARLEYEDLAAGGRRVELRYPMLDVEFLEFFAGIPSGQKRRRGVGRLLYRRALEGLVPDQTRLHGGGASANPGELLRREAARDELLARLRALPADSRLWDYADLEKLGGPLEMEGGGRRVTWRRTSVLVTLLVLEAKLREAAGAAAHAVGGGET